MKVNVMFARFPYMGIEHPDVHDWLLRTHSKVKKDPRVDRVFSFQLNDTPITMGRNRALKNALEIGADYVCMVDADMAPDLPYADAVPFWDVAWEHMMKHIGEPCVIGAPYTGPYPDCSPYIFRWRKKTNDARREDWRLEMWTREEAAQASGLYPVAALPTGLILIDVRVLDGVKPPWFYYEYTDKFETQKASTEDVAFTRDVSLAGFPLYATFNSWAGHWKQTRMDKPTVLTADMMAEKFTEVAREGANSRARKVYVGANGVEGLTPGRQPVGA